MKRVEGSIDIVEQRADILFAKNILPRRHRGSGQAFPDRVGNALPASVRHEVRIAQVARMRFEELAYPVFPVPSAPWQKAQLFWNRRSPFCSLRLSRLILGLMSCSA